MTTANSRLAIILLAAAFAAVSGTAAIAQDIVIMSAPYTRTLSNTFPLKFGMTPDDAALALGSPLTYVSGRPGNEVFVTLRNVGGSGFFVRNDPLYLQFRRGHLTGWKGDWARNWMWQ